jgi:hypothetical protein
MPKGYEDRGQALNDIANAQLQQPPPAGPAPRPLLRELLLAGLALVFGVLVMPCVIFAVGRASLGPYEHGGVFALWRDFLAGLAHGSQAFWFVAVAPYLLLCVLRLARRLLHN